MWVNPNRLSLCFDPLLSLSVCSFLKIFPYIFIVNFVLPCDVFYLMYGDVLCTCSAATSARAPSSAGSSMLHSHPGSAARARERAQALQAYFQQPRSLPSLRTPLFSGSRRSNSQAQVGQAGSSSDQIHGGGIYYLPTSGSSTTRSGFQEAESSMPNPFYHTWERDPYLGPGWGSHQGGGGGGSGAVFRLRHGLERTPSQGHYRS